MLRFEDPIYLWALLIVPILLLIRFLGWRSRKAKLKKFGDPELLKELMPDVSKYRPTVKFFLALTALALLIVVLARPQMGSKISNEKREGIETIIAVDISNSMYAQDVAPSRIDKAKMLIEDLVDNFSNDKVGLVVFAGESYIQLPITSDYVSAKMFLHDIDPSLIQTQGTDIAGAINLSMKSFTKQQNVGKAIIVITDGEDHEGGAEQAAANAHKQGVYVFIMGIGDTKGSPIPMDGEYLKDNSGNVVMSRLNEEMCRKIASAGSGKYIHVDNTSEAEEILNADLAKLQKGDASSVVYSEYAEKFQTIGILVVLLLIIEVCIMEAKNSRMKDLHIFKRASLLIALFTMVGLANAQSDRDYIRQGNRNYNAENFAQAETSYRKALSKNPGNTQAMYNLGMSLLGQQKVQEAAKYLEQAGKEEPNKLRKAKSYHNLGWMCQKMRDYNNAINYYKMALRNNPSDEQTRYNLALCQHQKKNQRDDKKDKKDDKKKKKKKEEKEQEQNQNPDKNKMSKDNAEQLLNAAVQNEKNAKQKIRKHMAAPRSRNLSKNW